jgi:hypothetical protein
MLSFLSLLCWMMLIMFLFSVYKHDDKGFRFFGLGLIILVIVTALSGFLHPG